MKPKIYKIVLKGGKFNSIYILKIDIFKYSTKSKEYEIDSSLALSKKQAKVILHGKPKFKWDSLLLGIIDSNLNRIPLPKKPIFSDFLELYQAVKEYDEYISTISEIVGKIKYKKEHGRDYDIVEIIQE